MMGYMTGIKSRFAAYRFQEARQLVVEAYGKQLAAQGIVSYPAIE